MEGAADPASHWILAATDPFALTEAFGFWAQPRDAAADIPVQHFLSELLL